MVVTVGETDLVPLPGQLTLPTPLLMLQEVKALLPCVAEYERVELPPAIIEMGEADKEHEGGL